MSLLTIIKKFSKVYHHAVTKHPLTAQSVQVATLMGIGDASAQLIQTQKIDLKRNAKFISLGLFYVGPVLYVWYRVLHRYVRGNTKTIIVFKKVLLDQLIFSPISLAAFLTLMGITERQDVAEIKTRIKDEFCDIMIANYSIWPCIQFVNFYFIPPKYQIVFNQAIACCWNCYVSFKTH